MKIKILPILKKVFVENIILKLVAVAFAIGLWMVVVNVDDPMQTRNMTAIVDVINEDVLTDAGKYYTINNGLNTVTFRVNARRSVMERLSGADFTAVADMNYLEGENRIPITITPPTNYSNVTITSKQLYLNVTIGNNMSTRYDINVITQGKVAPGMTIDSVSSDITVVSVNGPEEDISRINQAVAYVDVAGISSDMSVSSSIHFLDQDGEMIDQSKISYDVDSVVVSVELLNIKTVPIVVTTSGSLPDGTSLTSVTTDPEEIRIVGDGDVLNDITSVVISGATLNLTELENSFETTVDITQFLPYGVKLASGEGSEVGITISVATSESTTLTINTTDDIEVRGATSDQNVSFVEDTIIATVEGTRDNISNLTAADLEPYVVVTGLGEGTHRVRVRYTTVDNVTISIDDVEVEISGD